jgi:hypothetical protein
MDNLGRRLEEDCRLRFRNMRLWLAASLILGIAFAAYNAVEAETLAGASLVQHLRQGGYVLLMRHAHSPPEPPASSVAERPTLGLNAIIVTHMPNIRVAFGQDAADLTDGEALVFHPDAHGGAPPSKEPDPRFTRDLNSSGVSAEVRGMGEG